MSSPLMQQWKEVLEPRMALVLPILIGILLPYITAIFWVPIINVPWSTIYGAIPFLLYDIVGFITGNRLDFLRVVGVLVSPLAVGYCVTKLSQVDSQPFRRLFWFAFITMLFINVPASADVGISSLPFYQKYLSF